MFTAYAATAAQAASDATTGTASQLTQLIELIFAEIPLWIAAFILVIVTILVAKIGRRMIENKLAEKGVDEEHKEIQVLGGRVTYAGIMLVGFTISLKIAGIDLTAVLAAVAFGIGFALRDIIMNFLAGIMLLVGRQFTIGDFIQVSGAFGRVMEIQSRVTILQAIDGTKIIMPNANLFKNKVISYTSNPFRRIDVYTAIDYRGDVENAMKLCKSVTKHTKGVLAQPEPIVLISDWGDSEIELRIRFWVESKGGWLKIKSNLLKNLTKAYGKYNISLPWPITQVVYDKDFPINEKTFTGKAKVAKDVAVTGATVATTVSVPVTGAITIPQDEQPLKPLAEL